MTEHARTPWSLFKQDIKNGEGQILSTRRQIRSADGEVIVDGVDEDCGTKIVTAVNSQPALLAACEGALKVMEALKADKRLRNESYSVDQLKAAIAQATKED